jgi:hypothetical protein
MARINILRKGQKPSKRNYSFYIKFRQRAFIPSIVLNISLIIYILTNII